MIRITCDTDCYYYTIKLSYPLPVYNFHDTVITSDILILLHWGNSSCMSSDYGDMGHMVYIWEFSCLDYSFDVHILWSRKLNLYRWFCRNCFYWVLLRISGFIIIIIILYIFTSWLTTCIIMLCMFPTWYHLLSLCVLLYSCAHNTVFNTCSLDSNLSIHVFLSL